jgi:hypothetical protein
MASPHLLEVVEHEVEVLHDLRIVRVGQQRAQVVLLGRLVVVVHELQHDGVVDLRLRVLGVEDGRLSVVAGVHEVEARAPLHVLGVLEVLVRLAGAHVRRVARAPHELQHGAPVLLDVHLNAQCSESC